MAERVVLVTGATRSLGRGMAREFAALGYVVAITGRNSRDLDQTAAEIEQRGARPIPLLCDHADDVAVKTAFARLASATSGRLDLLVNNAAAVHGADLVAPGGFWEKPLHLADMITIGLRSNYVAAYYAAPMMIARRQGLIVNISFYGAVSYFHGPAYGAAKAGTDKMTADMAADLAVHGVYAVSLWPGFVLTDYIRSLPSSDMPDEMRASLPLWETPGFSARVLDRLLLDPELTQASGTALIGAELGKRYGIDDEDGRSPPSYRETMGAPIDYRSSEDRT